jgi:hypothetical protein
MTHYPPLTLEHIANYVPVLFSSGEEDMVRAVVAEAAALASLALFLGMIAIWAQVIATL